MNVFKGNVKMTEENIAYCGVDCSACPDKISDKCPGCRRAKRTSDDVCLPARCCRKKGIDCRGERLLFPCRDIRGFYEESEGHKAAYLKMLLSREERKRRSVEMFFSADKFLYGFDNEKKRSARVWGFAF